MKERPMSVQFVKKSPAAGAVKLVDQPSTHDAPKTQIAAEPPRLYRVTAEPTRFITPAQALAAVAHRAYSIGAQPTHDTYVLAHRGQPFQVRRKCMPSPTVVGSVVRAVLVPDEDTARVGGRPLFRADRIEPVHPAGSGPGVEWLHAADPRWILWPDDYALLVDIVDRLRRPLSMLVHEAFRNDSDLAGFLLAPASLRGHHSHDGGLLDHTLQVVEIAKGICAKLAVDMDLVLAACVLHDVGKSREYSQSGFGYGLSEVGELCGHKISGVRMIEGAAARVPVDERTLSVLMNAIAGATGPHYMGLPDLKTLEAHICSKADGLSAVAGLRSRLGGDRPGWTTHHPHAPGGFLSMGSTVGGR